MSCSYPLLIQPVYFENYCLVDGGLTNALPIPEKAFILNPNKILALELPSSDEKSNNSQNSEYSELSQDDNIIKYILQLFSSCKSIIFNNSKQLNIKNKVVIKCNNSLSNWFKSINSKEIRENYMGAEVKKRFFIGGFVLSKKRFYYYYNKSQKMKNEKHEVRRYVDEDLKNEKNEGRTYFDEKRNIET